MRENFGCSIVALFGGLLVSLWKVPAWPCSIFTASDGQSALAGNNEDYLSGGFDTGFWIEPPRDGFHGFVLVGYSVFEGQRTLSAQGGANDQGLFLDANAVPLLEARANSGRDPAAGLSLYGDILGTCATVQEALDALASYNLTGLIERGKIFIADRSGDAAIFEGTSGNGGSTTWA